MARWPSTTAVALATWLAACSAPERGAVPTSTDAPPAQVAPTTDAGGEVNPRLLRRFQPIPRRAEPVTPDATARVTLGRQLFFDARLSLDRDLSCNSCHDLSHYGVDGRQFSPGTRGARGKRNSPTVLNAAGHFAQFWDGRSATVEEQASVPMLDPGEMALSPGEVVARLEAVPDYVQEFRVAFPDDARPISLVNVGVAIGAFERTLFLRSRWDRYLEGDKAALTGPEKDGLRVFLNSGCMVCHTGKYLGGSMFERLGAVEPWPDTRDVGRMAVTGLDADRMMFKVPSLRNVEKTAPYFHDGSAATLEIAVQRMGRHQLGIDLVPEEVASIVTWLKSLTADLPPELVARPRLPGEGASPATRRDRKE